MPHKLIRIEVKGVHILQCFASAHSAGSENLLLHPLSKKKVAFKTCSVKANVVIFCSFLIGLDLSCFCCCCCFLIFATDTRKLRANNWYSTGYPARSLASRVSTRAGWPGISVLSLVELTRLICHFYFGVTALTIV